MARSAWYFYNPVTVRKGKEWFERVYGPRPLEDYWLISNKEVLSETVVEDTVVTAEEDPYIERLLEEIQQVAQDVHAMDAQKATALWQATLATAELDWYDVTDSLIQEILALTVHDTPFLRQVCLVGYLNAREAGWQVRALRYQQCYVQHGGRLQSGHDSLQVVYQRLWPLFERGQDSLLVSQTDFVDSLAPNGFYSSRLMFIRAVALARMHRTEQARFLLRKLVGSAADTEVQKRAQRLLAIIEKQTTAPPAQPVRDEDTG